MDITMRNDAAADGTDAQYRRGYALLTGEGMERDVREGVHILTRLAKDGHLPSIRCLGNCLIDGVGAEPDPDRGAQLLLIAAEGGDADAQHDYAVCLHYGEGVERDIRAAIAWYAKAAEQGELASQVQLGSLLYTPEDGSAPDYERAFYWNSIAAEKSRVALGNLGVAYRVGRGVAKDEKKAFELFSRLAAMGDAHGMFLLGLCYNDRPDTPENASLAREWIGRAAEAGEAKALMFMGFDALDRANATGFEADYQEAFRWFSAAREAGENAACFELGCLYQNGTGVQKDMPRAMEMFRIGAGNGDERAAQKLLRFAEPEPAADGRRDNVSRKPEAVAEETGSVPEKKETEERKHCGHCGALLTESAKFCTVCGMSADGQQNAPPAKPPHTSRPVRPEKARKGLPMWLANPKVYLVASILSVPLAFLIGILGVLIAVFGTVAMVLNRKRFAKWEGNRILMIASMLNVFTMFVAVIRLF